jgi:hypothetical protein
MVKQISKSAARWRERPDWDNPNWHPPRRRPPWPATSSGLREDELRLLDVFLWLARRHGDENACKMFANFLRKPSKTQVQDLTRKLMFERLDNEKPRPTVRQLSRDLGVDERTIKRWKKERAATEAAFGPVSPPLAKDEPAEFVLHRPRRK